MKPDIVDAIAIVTGAPMMNTDIGAGAIGLRKPVSDGEVNMPG